MPTNDSERLRLTATALYNLFQACSNLCMEDMEKLEEEIIAASRTLEVVGDMITKEKPMLENNIDYLRLHGWVPTQTSCGEQLLWIHPEIARELYNTAEAVAEQKSRDERKSK